MRSTTTINVKGNGASVQIVIEQKKGFIHGKFSFVTKEDIERVKPSFSSIHLPGQIQTIKSSDRKIKISFMKSVTI